MNDKYLLLQYRIYTGMTEDAIDEALRTVTCNHIHALEFYKALGRMPTEMECQVINEHGINDSLPLFRRGVNLIDTERLWNQLRELTNIFFNKRKD